MKSIKVFYHGERLKDIYPFATKWQVFKYKVRKFFRKVFIVTIAFTSLFLFFYVGFHFGAFVNPKISYADRTVEVVVEADSPVMKRIAQCESGGKHTRNGQVIFNANTNKTVDIGKYQINSIWSTKATELGLDLTKEKDNEAFAMYLYKNYGTEPWYSSKSCWSK